MPKTMPFAFGMTVCSMFAAGIGLLIWSHWELSDTRWSPLFHQPIPQSRLQTKADFRCASGNFEIVVELPMSAKQKAASGPVLESPPISCKLNLTIREGNDIVFTSNVYSLAWTGIVGSSAMNTFKAGAVEISKRGLYVFEMKNDADENLLYGGSLSLIRDENAENASVVCGLARFLSYTLLGLSFASIIWKIIKNGSIALFVGNFWR